ncbi:MAG: AI-2E family transporter [Lachnospiraceae bacterium]|jgi:predicted PurR-regulated permease PerM|nr:AI-2E family transporter [Lachnospiraceae bacterium]MEE3460913.1 AI-2E family transporter [Lachnospiraceae bacterium]
MDNKESVTKNTSDKSHTSSNCLDNNDAGSGRVEETRPVSKAGEGNKTGNSKAGEGNKPDNSKAGGDSKADNNKAAEGNNKAGEGSKTDNKKIAGRRARRKSRSKNSQPVNNYAAFKDRDVRTRRDNFMKSSAAGHLKEIMGNWYGLFIVILFSLGIFIIITQITGIAAFCKRILRILTPFIIGAVIAYILNPIVKKLYYWMYDAYRKGHKKKGKKINPRAWRRYYSLSIAISLLLFLLFIYGLLSIVIPQVFNTIIGLANSLPQQASDLYDKIYNWVTTNKYIVKGIQETSLSLTKNFDDMMNESIFPFIEKQLLPNVNNLATGLASGVFSAFGVVVDIIVGIIFAVYLLGQVKGFAAVGQKLTYGIFNKRTSEIIIHYTRIANMRFGGFIIGKLINSIFVGIICFICMMLLKLPYAMLIAVIIGVTNMIPFFGAYIGAIPSALLILLVSPVKCITFLIFLIILKQINGNIIAPAILGNTTGLSAFWVLFSIILFGGLFGIVGMILGVPIFAVIYNIIKDIIDYRLIRKSLEPSTASFVNLKYIDVEESGRKKYDYYTEDEVRRAALREEAESRVTLSSIIFKNEDDSRKHFSSEEKKQ